MRLLDRLRRNLYLPLQGTDLSQLRTELGWSPGELAKNLSCSLPQVTDLEQGRSKLSAADRYRLRRLLRELPAPSAAVDQETLRE